MKLIKREELNLVDIRTDEYWNRLRIFSLLGSNNFKNNSILSNILNKSIYSRSSVLDILKSSKIKKISEDSKLLNLGAQDYIIENLPIFTFLKLSSLSLHTIFRLRDCKYIDRDTTFFVRIPEEIAQNMNIRKEYEAIQLKSIGNYREFYYSKRKGFREFAHLLLPLGVQNRSILSLSTNQLLELTNSLHCSDMVIENQLGDMFEELLKPDINVKVRCKQREVVRQVLNYLKEIICEEQLLDENHINEFHFDYVKDPVENLISNFEQLVNPLGSKKELEFDYKDQIQIGQYIRNNYLGNIATSKGSVIKGYLSIADILELLQLNYTLFIPLLFDSVDIDKELDRANKKCFLLPKKLSEKNDLRREFRRSLISIYSDIKSWREKSKKYMSDEVSKEFTKYLFPLAHMTRFNWYLDINDILGVNDLDWQYSEDIRKKFFQKDPLFKK